MMRAELYASDSYGRRIPRVARLAIGYGVMPVRPTRRHALSDANTLATEEQNEDDRREREARRRFDALTPEAREILRLSLARGASVERRMPFPSAQRKAREAGGWYFVKYAGVGNRTAVMACRVVRHLTHEEIADHLGLSVYAVRRRLSSIGRRLARYAELRGWV
jgi:RNA polymerase sigma factor (sigma-70 family)